MGYIASADIHAYPVASRGTDFPYARLTTEYNLTENLRAFSDKNGFVVNSAGSIVYNTSSDISPIVKFVIHGYYFEAKAKDIVDAADGSGNTVYAKIVVNETMSAHKSELLSQATAEPAVGPTDIISNGTFAGISFDKPSNPPVSSGDTYYAPIFDVSVSGNEVTCIIKEEYCYRLSGRSVGLEWQPLPTSHS